MAWRPLERITRTCSSGVWPKVLGRFRGEREHLWPSARWRAAPVPVFGVGLGEDVAFEVDHGPLVSGRRAAIRSQPPRSPAHRSPVTSRTPLRPARAMPLMNSRQTFRVLRHALGHRKHLAPPVHTDADGHQDAHVRHGPAPAPFVPHAVQEQVRVILFDGPARHSSMSAYTFLSLSLKGLEGMRNRRQGAGRHRRTCRGRRRPNTCRSGHRRRSPRADGSYDSPPTRAPPPFSFGTLRLHARRLERSRSRRSGRRGRPAAPRCAEARSAGDARLRERPRRSISEWSTRRLLDMSRFGETVRSSELVSPRGRSTVPNLRDMTSCTTVANRGLFWLATENRAQDSGPCLLSQALNQFAQNLSSSVKQMPSSLKNTHSQLR